MIDLTAKPGAASGTAAWKSQARMELSLLMGNGEQLLLTLIIPVVLLVGLTQLNLLSYPDNPVTYVVPGVLSVAILSTAFTSTAIATGFDRRYGILKFLGTTPLSRVSLGGAKVTAVLIVEAIQVALITGIGLLLGWDPNGSVVDTLAIVVLATCALGSLGVALAGLLRAEATLAVANGVFLLLMLAGGMLVPLTRLPDGLASAAALLPTGALGEGLREVLINGSHVPLWVIGNLVVWTAIGTGATARWFRWE